MFNGTLDILKRRARVFNRIATQVRSKIGRPQSTTAKPATLNDFERRIYSQNGEDGIIAEIFKRIGTTNRFVVEFGVEDGIECNAANLLRQCGWSGVLLEGDAATASRLEKNYAPFSGVRTAQQFITADNIATIFEDFNVPFEFDLLSIDIDGNDYWVWSSLKEYRPRVVVIEYNAMYPPPFRWIMKYEPDHRWDGSSHHGASLTALWELGKSLGYSLVVTDSRGINAFFVRDDLLTSGAFEALTPESAYHAPRYGLIYRHHPYRPGAAVTS